MEEDIVYKSLPKHYLFCINDNCECSEQCLRRLAAKYGKSKDVFLQVLNPDMFGGKTCRYFKEKKIVKMAYGMKHSYDNVLANNIAPLRNAINSYFGNGSYYKRRNGILPITPDEQEFISNTFKAYGYTDGVVFDRYVDEPEW
ncbi:MAG: hypothetical protein IJE12_00105 [Prevotella sp.]|nr:hypothetical protein [Prevotella sp.]